MMIANEGRKELLLKRKDYLIKINNKIAELFGEVGCIICDSHKNLDFHEIHGKKHPKSPIRKYEYMLKHKKDFLPLCSRHHYLIHRIAKRIKKEPNPELLFELIQKIIYQKT